MKSQSAHTHLIKVPPRTSPVPGTLNVSSTYNKTIWHKNDLVCSIFDDVVDMLGVLGHGVLVANFDFHSVSPQSKLGM